MRAAIALFVGALTGAAAIADSDGYYCLSERYLAYELRLLDDTEGRHTLFVVTPASEGVVDIAELELPDFQVHGMRCLAESVELLGWDRMFQIDVREPRKPAILSDSPVADPPANGLPPGFASLNLAQWNNALRTADSALIHLPWSADPYRFHVAVTSKKSDVCRYELESRIVVTPSDPEEPPRVFPIVSRSYEQDCGD